MIHSSVKVSIVATLALAAVGVPWTAQADTAPRVAMTFDVKVSPGKADEYAGEIKKLRAAIARLGSKATLRAWNVAVGGPDAGSTIVVTEYPDQATWAADSTKLQADAEAQKIQAGLAGIRTLTDSSLWREITPNPGPPTTGSVLAITGVTVKPGKLEEYRTRVASIAAISGRLGIKSKVRLWQSDVAGTNTGGVVVGIEYPDLATYVADQQKLSADAEWQKTLASLDEVRTVSGRWLYREVAP